MKNREHHYESRLRWEGNRGTGTGGYDSYGREHRISIAGKSDLVCSADPVFHGDPHLHNPEDLFLAAISSCHMLTYLALCARHRIAVLSYEDRATAVLRQDVRGVGRFESVELHPSVTVAEVAHVGRATHLHEKAHQLCFIARSCSVAIHHRAEVRA